MSLTIYNDTFTAGTAGADLTGQVADTTNNGSDVYSTFSPFPSLVYAAGGGATSATLSSSQALSTYPLTAAAQDQTITVTVTSANLSAHPLLQFHRGGDGNDELTLSLDLTGGVVNFQPITGGTPGTLVQQGSISGYPLINTSYTIGAVLTGSTLSVTLNGVPLTNLTNLTVPTGTRDLLLIGQAGGSAGDVKFTEARVQVPSATGCTVTGAGSIIEGAASTFTYMLNGPSPDGGLTITPLTTVFTASFGAGSVSIGAGQTSGTEAVTATSAGTGTVTGTASGIAFTPASVTASSGSPSPTLTVSPTSGTVVDASTTLSITPTRANSSAALTASVSGGGTISTAIPTSGTPFTYTPPASGSGTATVTVTDSPDGLTATCTVAYAPAALAPTTITVTPSGTITEGMPVTFTATLDHPALSAGITYIPASTVFAATFSPTLVTFAEGEVSKTFTVTSSTAGAGTVGAVAS